MEIGAREEKRSGADVEVESWGIDSLWGGAAVAKLWWRGGSRVSIGSKGKIDKAVVEHVMLQSNRYLKMPARE